MFEQFQSEYPPPAFNARCATPCWGICYLAPHGDPEARASYTHIRTMSPWNDRSLFRNMSLNPICCHVRQIFYAKEGWKQIANHKRAKSWPTTEEMFRLGQQRAASKTITTKLTAPASNGGLRTASFPCSRQSNGERRRWFWSWTTPATTTNSTRTTTPRKCPLQCHQGTRAAHCRVQVRQSSARGRGRLICHKGICCTGGGARGMPRTSRRRGESAAP